MTLGKSLHEDDQALWNKLDQLFKLRNRMAHVAYRPPLDIARALVIAAEKAFKWIDADP